MARRDEFDISRSRTFLSLLALDALSLTGRGGSVVVGIDASSLGEDIEAIAPSIELLDENFGASGCRSLSDVSDVPIVFEDVRLADLVLIAAGETRGRWGLSSGLGG